MKNKLLFKDSFLCLLLSIVIIWLLSFLVLNISIFNPFTNAFKDFSFLDLYYSENLENQKPSNDILLVNIENRDRFEISQLLETILSKNPKIIGIDAIFKEARDPFVDSLLNKSFQNKKIVLSKAFITNKWQKNASIFNKDEDLMGYSNLNFDNNNTVIRTFEGKKNLLNTSNYSFSSIISKQFDEKKWKANNLEKKIENILQINYTGNYKKFNALTFDEALNKEQIFFENKIIIIGYLGIPLGNNNDVEDKFFTPVNSVTSGKSLPDTFGVTIHANIIKMLIENKLIYKIPTWLLYLNGLILTYFAIMLFMYLNHKNPVSYMFLKKIMQLGITILLLWFSLLLYNKKVLFKPEIIIVMMVISVELIGLYKIIIKKLNLKYKWQSYFFQ